MIHVHVIYEYGIDQQPHGSAYIRLLNPLSHPALAGRIRLTSGRDFEPADIIIVDRTWKYHASLQEVENLIGTIRRSGAGLIYSLDDNLLDLDLSGGFRTGFTLEQLAFIRLLAREADGVMVSTFPLAERMKRLNPHVVVVPNALDERLFAPRRPSARTDPTGKLTVGYMGTFTHEDDLYMILEALRPLAKDITLELVGGLSDPRAGEGFYPLSVVVRDTGGRHVYPDFVDWMSRELQWDVGLAPLEDSPFTRCKSDIKFLDYSLLGIPGIYSRVPAYQDTVQHGVTGILADNTPAEWRSALESMIASPEKRQAIAHASGQWARRHRTLEGCAGQWADVMETIAGTRTNQQRNPDKASE